MRYNGCPCVLSMGRPSCEIWRIRCTKPASAQRWPRMPSHAYGSACRGSGYLLARRAYRQRLIAVAGQTPLAPPSSLPPRLFLLLHAAEREWCGTVRLQRLRDKSVTQEHSNCLQYLQGSHMVPPPTPYQQPAPSYVHMVSAAGIESGDLKVGLLVGNADLPTTSSCCGNGARVPHWPASTASIPFINSH